MSTITSKLASGSSSASASTPAAAIVVGSGLAGLSAASQLISRNVPVYLLERASKPGGNSIKASSGINGAPTRFQPIHDTLFYDDTIRSAGAALNATASLTDHRRRLISTLTNASAGAIEWLVDEKGIDLSRVAQLGGHSVPRTHRGAGKLPPGAAIVTTLLNSLKASPLFHLQTGCHVTRVLHSSSNNAGQKGTQTQILHGPVIFASGGFAGDAKGMLAQYRPDLAGYPSTNDPREGSQKLLSAVGAQLLDMDLVQVHPTGFVDTSSPTSPLKFLAAELLRGEGGILVRGDTGQRFVNEMETREYITNVITKLAPRTSFDNSPETKVPKQWDVLLILDQGTYEAAPSHIDFYLWKGLMKKTTVGSLAQQLNDPAGPPSESALLETLKSYAATVSTQKDARFHRKTFGHWRLTDPATITPETTIYVGRVTPVVHFTMGGVLIDENAQVLRPDSTPIKNVWAAGEVTGGIHGDNRLGGSSLLECVVFGRIAGDQAAESLLERRQEHKELRV
ncbi:Flavocytochrome c [Xylona heveae TC161]|uniref:Fumarate reductase n=1 Tax=Xylona heveae (strain CBS 132557 / TC161) TaxID=1328760 RepID=A0A164ZK58_XYLHT|nr:Flavocytochrome c [Xylona heveae TC161]KZF19194.1 Flavocytochrome c [Xylona heveae TC161]